MLLLICLCNQGRFEIARNPTGTSVTLFPLLIWPSCCIYACAFIPELLSLQIYQFCDNTNPPLPFYVVFPFPLHQ